MNGSVVLGYMQTDAPPIMLGVVVCVLAVVCKRMQRLPTMLGPAVHRERIQPISLCKPCVMSVRGPNNVGRAVKTDATLLRYALAITEQKKCWELLAEKFDRFQTLCNNTQQHPTTCNRVCKRTQHVTSNNAGSCWPTMLHPFAWGFTRGTCNCTTMLDFKTQRACLQGKRVPLAQGLPQQSR